MITYDDDGRILVKRLRFTPFHKIPHLAGRTTDRSRIDVFPDMILSAKLAEPSRVMGIHSQEAEMEGTLVLRKLR